ncbi:uncharacterized protein PODANS_1_24440 [Podospora anserina S mat+]|uniref:Podospora anserina S mat+ genomic DNA chromosome 1, supercontig 6 n=1 Tax=Podospora anserina (strain S / ATCC MYA-4624 / DSM 980 / FGSC 10383) TaxID=515849 RepID=B2ASR8_PODAN|nr:uncharacterized protein PODANS_1_24440 [Podospora anserina S mat+]CAP67441.1 unnamed protein product [Podospora anserina S mat+]CDP24855.1 Putative signal transduction histidine-protein kinase [Podospora anserina S mat+]
MGAGTTLSAAVGAGGTAEFSEPSHQTPRLPPTCGTDDASTTATEDLDLLESIKEVLDADSRPTFVLDLDPDDPLPITPIDTTGSPTTRAKVLLPVFCNAALRLYEQLYDGLIGLDAQGLPPEQEPQDASFDEFKRWATGVTTHDDSKDVFPLSFLYGDLLWTGSTVRKRWRLISGNRLWRAAEVASPVGDLSSGAPAEVATGGFVAEHSLKAASQKAPPSERPTDTSLPVSGTTIAVRYSKQKSGRPPPKSFFSTRQTPAGSSDDTTKSSASITLAAPEKSVADWTCPEPRGVLSAHLQYARTVNWAITPLGPMEKWSPEFKQTANLCMNNPHPAALFWGSELTMLYNEAYATEVAGNKHPSLMGTGFSGPFSELWDYLRPIFAECARTGISVRKEDDYLPIDRHGLLEETFFSWSFTPMYGGTDRILGFYNAPFETTKQVINRRRMHTINKIGERTAQAKAVKQFWKFVLEGLQDNERDVPFALLYSVGDGEGEDNDHSSMSSGSTISLKTCHLEGSIGVPDGHMAAPTHLDLKRSREGFVPSFREAMRTREPTLLHTRDGTLPEVLLEGINWRGFGDPCREAVIFPVRPTNGDAVLAFLVLGVNPRRPYNDEYKAFTSMLNRQLATSLASVILFEDETRRSRDAAEAAALEKEQLTQQLNLQASRYRRMTELSPLGMFLISPEGVLREANDRFFEMTGHTRDNNSQYEMSWLDIMVEESANTMREGWERLVKDHLPWSGELKLRKPRINPALETNEPMDSWVLFSAHAELSHDSTVRSVMGSITDISHLKWAQGLQNRRLQEAEETRRQQNEFIDITSHEMRNPLTAILQCADDILSALGAGDNQYQGTEATYRGIGNASSVTPQTIQSCIDAAQTIALCVQHQKSIVDDILTISKLDSNLLLLTPVPCQPKLLLRRAVKMFEPELQAKKIEVSFDIRETSLTGLSVDWVAMDPSRVLQVLINLLTNAIKFTAPAKDKRLITVALDASLNPPDARLIPGFQYVPVSFKAAGGYVDSKTSALGPEDEMPDATAPVPSSELYLYFHVQDSGCGLTHEEKQILFQRFKQASPRTHAQYGGSGLGLFISKRLAELHGGQIGVASEAGVGSVFGFFVKVRRAAPSPVSREEEDAFLAAVGPMERHLHPVGERNTSLLSSEAVKQEGKGYSGVSSAEFSSGASLVGSMALEAAPARPQPFSRIASDVSSTFDPKQLDILVVEDNLINQRVLVRQLKQYGCNTVGVANDGLEALAFLEKTHFCRTSEENPGQDLSVILMDLEMPNMDGLTCVREIRKWQQEGKVTKGKHVPVIAVTANVRDEQVATARKSGMDDVVSKPFRIKDLMKKIEVLLGQDLAGSQAQPEHA